MIPMISTYEKEPTLLLPGETTFTVDAWLYDATHIESANRNGEYVVVFAPYTFYDHQRIAELVESAVVEVEMRKGFHSRKQGKALVERDGGLFYSSQLFTPKVNVPFDHSDQLMGKLCSIKGYLRDLPDGCVVINLSYVDLYDPFNGLDDSMEEQVMPPSDCDDW